MRIDRASDKNLLPEEALPIALILKAKLKALTYTHNETKHQEILGWLDGQEFQKLAKVAKVVMEGLDGERFDTEGFRKLILHQARRARAGGLVKPDGAPRKKRGAVNYPAHQRRAGRAGAA